MISDSLHLSERIHYNIIVCKNDLTNFIFVRMIWLCRNTVPIPKPGKTPDELTSPRLLVNLNVLVLMHYVQICCKPLISTSRRLLIQYLMLL